MKIMDSIKKIIVTFTKDKIVNTHRLKRIKKNFKREKPESLNKKKQIKALFILKPDVTRC